MSDPTIAVQKAVMDRLKATVPSVAGQVLDSVQNAPAGDYITVTVPSAVPLDEVCWDRSEINFQIDFWSSHPDSGRVKVLAAQGRAGLHEVDDLAPQGFTIDRIRVEGIFYSREAQTLINRARMVLAVEAQPN